MSFNQQRKEMESLKHAFLLTINDGILIEYMLNLQLIGAVSHLGEFAFSFPNIDKLFFIIYFNGTFNQIRGFLSKALQLH